VLEHSPEEQTNCWLSIFMALPSSIRRRKMSLYVYIFIAAIPVNYNSDFL
jgi:hypothetical protein